MDLITIIGIVVLCLIIYAVIQSSNSSNKLEQAAREPELARLKATYDAALQSGDKADALQKGRAYYSFLRGGTLTMYDEQALANDLSVMG